MCRLASSLPLRVFLVGAFLNVVPAAHASSIATQPHRDSLGYESWLAGSMDLHSSLTPDSPDDWLGGTGYWDNGADWSVGVPGGSSDVVIATGSDNVTLDQNASINSLTLGGSTGTSTLTEPFGRGLFVQIAGALTINQSGTLTLAGDAITANANSSNAGSVNLNNNSALLLRAGFANTGTIQLNGEFFRPAITVSGALTNSGNIIDLDDTAVLSVGGTVNNSALIAIYSLTSGTLTNTVTGSLNVQMLNVNGDLVNAGQVYGYGRGSQFSIAGMLTNSGRFDVSYSTANVGGLNNSGEVFVGGNMTVHGNAYNSGGIYEGYIGPSNGQILIAYGAFTNAPTGNVELDGPYTGGLSATSIVNQGTITLNGAPLSTGSLANSGTIQTGTQSGGNNLSVTGTLTNAAGGVLSLGGMSDVANIAYMNNAGSVSIGNDATLNITGGSHAVANAFPGFLNSGTLVIAQGGTFSSPLTFTQIAGQTTVDGTLRVAGRGNVNFAGGAVYGNDGMIQGNVISNAAFNMGDMPMTVGTMAISGNYTQGANGSLAFDIASLTSYDQLNMSGRASLNGTLYVDLLNGYVPQIGNMFDIMNFAGKSGTFSMVLGLPINGQEHFVLEYNPTDLTLDVVAGPDTEPTSGRANGNVYYYEPYVSDVMQGANPVDNLGASPASSVPEPGSLALLTSGIVGVAGLRRQIAR